MFDLFGAFQRIEIGVCLMWDEGEGVPYIANQSIIKELGGNDINLSYLLCSVQLLSHVQLVVTLCTAACQASLSITDSWSLLKFMFIKLVMPSNHLILCHPLLFLPSVFPSIRVFSNESVLVDPNYTEIFSL